MSNPKHYTAVVLDQDNMVCFALITLLQRVIPNLNAHPISSVAELGGINHVVKEPIDLLVSNVVIGHSFGNTLLDRITRVGPRQILFYHEDKLTPPDALLEVLLHGHKLLSLNAPTSVWAGAIVQLLTSDTDSQESMSE